MQTSADGAPAPDNLSDFQFPKLKTLLAEYLGAVQLREAGNVDAAYVGRKLDKLVTTCRAADKLIEIMAEPARAKARAMRARVLIPFPN